MKRLAVASAVVAGWAALNGVLVIVLVVYREAPMAIALYAGAVVLVFAFGAAVWVRHGSVPQVRRTVPMRGASAVAGAFAVAMIGLSFIYRFAVALALAALVLTLMFAIRDRRGSGRP